MKAGEAELFTRWETSVVRAATEWWWTGMSTLRLAVTPCAMLPAFCSPSSVLCPLPSGLWPLTFGKMARAKVSKPPASIMCSDQSMTPPKPQAVKASVSAPTSASAFSCHGMRGFVFKDVLIGGKKMDLFLREKNHLFGNQQLLISNSSSITERGHSCPPVRLASGGHARTAGQKCPGSVC